MNPDPVTDIIAFLTEPAWYHGGVLAAADRQRAIAVFWGALS